MIIMPPASVLFELDQFECLGDLAKRGVDVEVYMLEEDVILVERDDRVRAVRGGVRVVPVPVIGAAFGYCCDREHLVMGVTRTRSSTMGRYDTFFGAYISNAIDPEKLLLDCAKNVDVPVAIKTQV